MESSDTGAVLDHFLAGFQIEAETNACVIVGRYSASNKLGRHPNVGLSFALPLASALDSLESQDSSGFLQPVSLNQGLQKRQDLRTVHACLEHGVQRPPTEYSGCQPSCDH